MSRIVIDESKCKGCGLCTTVCPFDLIRIADRFNSKGYRPAEYTESDNNQPTSRRCTGCTNCAAMCPDAAITVYRSRAKPRLQTRPSLSSLADRQVSRTTNDPHKGNGRDQQLVPQNTQTPKLP